MLSFKVGYEKIVALASPLPAETVTLNEAFQRILRQDIVSLRPHPASDISAMDGFAVHGEFKTYNLVGEVAAGQNFGTALQSGEAVRIFTGANIPQGADRVLIQENAELNQLVVSAREIPQKGANIRLRGGDFDIGFTLPSPRRLSAADIALIGAMNHFDLHVAQKPKIAIIATGSELVEPGQAQTNTQVIASNAFGIQALARQYGAEAEILPIVEDNPEKITKALRDATNYDLVVTTGGASVGKYDFVEACAKEAGFQIELHKIALRPGKPIMAGKRDNQVFLGLPGNPVSSMICAALFMRAVIFGQLGRDTQLRTQIARTSRDIPPNGDRTHFMRAHITQNETGFLAEIVSNQDSAAISLLSKTNGLVVMQPSEPAKIKGDLVEFIDLKP